MRYHNITTDDMLNGDGLRVVLWVAGCGHACPGCHNPITWDENGGLPFDEAAKEEIFTELAKDYVSGVTFSGGDPLYPANREQVGALAREVHARFPEKTIWLYTGFLMAYSGYTFEELMQLSDPYVKKLLGELDLLVDGRFLMEQKNIDLRVRGSANQRVIDVRRTRETGTVCLHENTDK